MPKAIRIYEHGGPEVMRWEEVDPGVPGPGEVLVRHTAVGLNFIDVYDRTGLYPTALPSGLGREAAGVVAALGRRARGFRVGDRVAYTFPSPGAYAEIRTCPADRLVRIPPGISDSQAAAIMLKGLTAHYLLRRTYRVKRGDTVLIHAAAGGVGLIACQWARHLGAKVIGVVGSDDKARLAKRHGCNHVIVTAR
ncbi:MAG TPA: quinone oxidoreductase, partial [Steroidobacteraceae bacterium]